MKINTRTVKDLVIRFADVRATNAKEFAERINSLTQVYAQVGNLRGLTVKELAREVKGRSQFGM